MRIALRTALVMLLLTAATVLGLRPVHAAEVYISAGPLGEMTVHVDGRIEDGDAVRIIAAIDQVLNVTDAVHSVVQFKSSGGVVREAIAIGYEIRRRHLPTLVRGECASACGFAFMSGIVRFVGPAAVIGFHSSAVCNGPNDCNRDEWGNAQIADYLKTIGVSGAAIEWMLSASPADLNYLTMAEAARYGIAISILAPLPCPGWCAPGS
jgi:hypothetical protein